MITKFKIFEGIYLEVGDYVKLKMIPDYVEFLYKSDEDLFVKIVDYTKSVVGGETYRFQLSDGERFIYGNQYLIRRMMNKREIAEFKLKEEANKYNL
jgi:hypothetical protein